MKVEDIAMWYAIGGAVVTIINVYIRKMEGDALLSFAWFLAWPLTPIGNLVRLIVHIIRALKAYQPYRRTKIYFLRKF